MASVMAALFFLVGMVDNDSGNVWLELAAVLAACVLGIIIADDGRSCLDPPVVLTFVTLSEVTRTLGSTPFVNVAPGLSAAIGLQFSLVEIIALMALFTIGIRARFGIPALLISIGSLVLANGLQNVIGLPVSFFHVLVLIFLIGNLINLTSLTQNE